MSEKVNGKVGSWVAVKKENQKNIKKHKKSKKTKKIAF